MKLWRKESFWARLDSSLGEFRSCWGSGYFNICNESDSLKQSGSSRMNMVQVRLSNCGVVSKASNVDT